MTTHNDVIYGSTPLENMYANTHPRLHFFASDLEALRPRLDQEPWRGLLADVRECADKSLLHQAFLFALTREDVWLKKAVQSINAYLDNFPKAFCSEYYLACAYDWLYHDLAPALRQRIGVLLDSRLRHEYEALAKHELYTAGTVGWNIASEELSNLAAAGFALYGEIPGMAPWVRFVTEKARVVTQALGPDGVSSEGICYGGFFNDTYTKTLDLVHRLMGVDLFEENAYLRNVPWLYLFLTIPRKRLSASSSVLCLGDGAPWHWYGPASYLHKIAARYRDPMAQAIARNHRAAGASTKASALYSLLWHDPSVSDRMPRRLPLSRHFADKDIVAMRSDWSGDESSLIFKCGPHGGHKALREYPQCIAGGHMAADAGTILFYANGDRLISDGGYAKKCTAYRNTVLVNGIGQTGEYDGSSDWFECVELRREKRGPSLLRVDSGETMDYLIGDVAPAYKPEAGLTRFLRHLIYLRPGTVIVVDELTAATPSIFELWFHADLPPGSKPERPFVETSPLVWETTAANGHCRLAGFASAALTGETGLQRIEGIGAHATREIDTLRIRNARPRQSAVVITVLDALKTGEQRPLPEVTRQGKSFSLRIATPGQRWTLRLQPGRKDPAAPIIAGVRARNAAF